jgi:glycosyltransferase involved in cell wall biosynthesis
MTFLSLILPVHNEEDIIEKVLKEIIATLKKGNITYEILLIENGSSDSSPKVVIELSKKYSYVRSLVSSKGYGNAILKGFSQSIGKYVCYMPSDGQVDLTVLPKLIKNIGKYNLVKVKRITRENLGRLLLSKLFDLSIYILFQSKLLDINGSPRIFARSVLKKLDLKAKDSFIDAEFTIKLSKLKWTVLEIPMENINRYGGKSTRNLKTYFEFIKNIIKYRTSSELTQWSNKVKP